MEIYKREKKTTLWVGKDAEGRKVYIVTANRGNIAVQPNAGFVHTIAEAKRDFREHRKFWKEYTDCH